MMHNLNANVNLKLCFMCFLQSKHQLFGGKTVSCPFKSGQKKRHKEKLNEKLSLCFRFLMRENVNHYLTHYGT